MINSMAPEQRIDMRVATAAEAQERVSVDVGACYALACWAQDEFAARGAQRLDISSWRIVVCGRSEVPQQCDSQGRYNGVDCGVFCIAAAGCIAEGHPFDYSLDSVPLLRRRCALRILDAGAAGAANK